MKGSKSTVCFTCASLHSRRPVERNVQGTKSPGTNHPGNETSKERNVHCVWGTKRLGNEKSINPRQTVY